MSTQPPANTTERRRRGSARSRRSVATRVSVKSSCALRNYLTTGVSKLDRRSPGGEAWGGLKRSPTSDLPFAPRRAR